MLIACATGMFVIANIRAAEPAAPAFADLSGDWTDKNPNSKNPNGVWEYRQGETKLPLISPWNGAATALAACAQPAWAPSNVRGNFLPALLMANVCSAHAFGADPNDGGHDNVLPGDVVMHTVDSANGNPARGQGNYTFTSKREGAFGITGMIWNAGFLSGRPQAWVVMHNAMKVASGALDGKVSRIRAQRFNAAVTLHQGDTIRLEFARGSGADYGYFVGVNLSVVGDVAQVTDERDRIRVALEAPVLFDFDRSDLRPSAEAALMKVKQSVLDQHPGARVLVEGYTDDRGAPDHNLTLSRARAQSVTAWLGLHGLPAALLQAKGLGSSQPRYPNTNEENRSHNRRVEISVLK
jgi:outer membrane protein OmpA-like peptidoglycan-associated protein